MYRYALKTIGSAPLTFVLSISPDGMSINQDTGVITWTPVPGQEVPNFVEVEASNSEGADIQSFTIVVNEEGGEVVTVEVRVADDAEETASGSMYLTSTDLELVYDDYNGADNQKVGIRFTGVDIPQGATIVNAYVQFQVDEKSSVATSLTIEGEDVDNATTFTSSSGDISSRIRTLANVWWFPVAWNTVGQAGLDQQTPDVSQIVQEIVARPGWLSGNSMAFIITGTGKRVAESYSGDQGGAPLLHVELYH